MDGFAHRANVVTFDSICKSCFRTIASRRLEPELEQDEKHHVCSRSDLERIQDVIERPLSVVPFGRVGEFRDNTKIRFKVEPRL